MPWYKKLNNILLPVQPIVIAGLVLVVLVSILAIMKGDKVQRTAWFIYLVSP